MAYVLLMFITLFYAIASAGVVLYFGVKQRSLGTLLIGLLLLSVIVPFFVITRFSDYPVADTVGFWMTLVVATGTGILLTIAASDRQNLKRAVLVTSIIGVIVYAVHVYLLSHRQ
jgi:hypothetical protein